ncbi:MAG TPA: PorP/SprF family type IX secretion system membrane protein [Flavisolibacter sp.]|nr:PorP/SprF family type IX secretion system membrane protein [Flavisolibacter sp.]
MRRTLHVMLLLLLAVVGGKTVHAQVDPHFSQYYVYPSWLNPALTGAFDGSYRVSGVYRSQWGSISPFKTYGLSADFTTDKNLNYGASILHQEAGNGGYQYTTAYANVAYTGVKFGTGDFQRVTFGFQGGVIQRRFNMSKMTWGDQWNPVTGYNPNTQTTDVLNRTSASSLDLGAGALYFDATPGKKANLYAGISASHLTQPDDKFSAQSDAKLPVRWTAHAGVRLNLSDELSLTPNALYLKQGTAEEKMIGAYAQLKATSVDVLVGANYRFKDAVSPYVGFTYRNMVLGASYDVNTSDLGKMVNGANSFEISLTFFGRKTAKTPEAEFICPAL